MAWENRGTRQYYYRKKRQNGRVHSEYVGTGIYAELAAWMDDENRADQERTKIEQERVWGEFMELSRQVDHVTDQLRSLTSATLQAHGYYMHRGQWRRHRE